MMKIKVNNIKIAVIFMIATTMLLLYPMPSKSYALSQSDAIIKKIESRYKNVHSMSAHFYQKEIIPGYSQSMSFKGIFYYGRSNTMAWVYTYPAQKRQVLKNNNLYIIDSRLKSITVVNVDKEKGGFPPNIIAGIGNLTRYFKVLDVKADAGKIEVKLEPKHIQRAKEIYIDFAANSLKIISLKIATYQGPTIIFRYSGVKFNSHINKDVFSVGFPPGYKIIKAN